MKYYNIYIYIYIYIYIFGYCFRTLSISLSLSVFLSLSPSPSAFLSLTVDLCLSICLSVALCLYLCLFLSVTLPVSLSLFPSISYSAFCTLNPIFSLLFNIFTYVALWIPYLTLPLFLVGHDVGYYGPPFFPVGSNFCASVYVHSCISGDVSQPSQLCGYEIQI